MTVERETLEALRDRLAQVSTDVERALWDVGDALDPPPYPEGYDGHTLVLPDPAVADAEWKPDPARARMARKVGRPRRKPEGEIVSEGMAWLNGLPRTKAWKIHGNAFSRAGEPDVDGCSDGRSLKFECKAGTERPTDLQRLRLEEWARTGALVGWFRSTDHLRQIMDHLAESDFVPDLDHPGCGCGVHVRDA